MFAHQREDFISLEGLCRYLLQRGQKITKQSLQERFTDAASAFMKDMVSHALKQKLGINFIWTHEKFKRILIGDATQFELPPLFEKFYKGSGGAASSSSIKVQYCYDLLSASIVSLVNRCGVATDYSSEISYLEKNDLVIEDLGYFNIERFKQIAKRGAYFLSRFRFGRVVFRKHKGQYVVFDLLKEEKKMKPGDIRQFQVWIDRKEKLPVRLILEKVPAQIANQKRRKLKTDKQSKRKNISKDRLRFCNLNAYITNASQEDLPMEKARNYYSLRWQIEIIFKAWKSVYKMDQVKSMKRQRFECMHFGLLLLVIIVTNIMICFKKIIWEINKKELSELKIYKCIKEVLPELSLAVLKKKNLSQFINDILIMVNYTCLKEQKSNKRSPFSILDMAA